MYSPPLVSGLTVHWRLDSLRIHARLVSSASPGGWLGMGFPVIVNQMIGSITVIGSSTEGVQVRLALTPTRTLTLASTLTLALRPWPWP